MIPPARGQDTGPSFREGERTSVSVVIPVKPHAEPLADFYRQYSEVLEGQRAWEFVFVAGVDGQRLLADLEPLQRSGHPIRVLRAGQIASETLLIKAAAAYCRGEAIVVLPPHRRVAPDALLSLVERLRGGVDVAVARRSPRKQSWRDRLKNRLYHRLLAGASGKRFHDLGNGVRAIRREVLDEIPVYGDLSPFLPLFAARAGLKVEEVSVPQHPADLRPRMRHGLRAYLHRGIDLLNLFFLLRFSERPLRFFGTAGAVVSGLGGAILVGLVIQRLGGTGIADRPILLLGALLIVLGAQAIALGLIGEVIVHLHATSRLGYRTLSQAGEEHRPVDSPESSSPSDRG